MGTHSSVYEIYRSPYRFKDGLASGPWTDGVDVKSAWFEMTSIGHYRFQELGSTKSDIGGNFILHKEDVALNNLPLNNSKFEGFVRVGQANGFDYTPAGQISTSALNAAGTAAIAATLPNNPTFSLAEFIGELRERCPSIIGSSALKEKARVGRTMGDEYLNVEFGWAPMMSELRNLGLAVKQFNKLLEQFRRGSNTKIRRRFEFPPTRTETVAQYGGFLLPTEANRSGRVEVRTTISKRKWFSGAFRYYLPVDHSAAGRFRKFEAEANKLFGTRLTPSVVWNLTPWSWAIDWFSETGNVIKAINGLGSDGMALQYGYVMSEVVRETLFRQEFIPNSGSYPLFRRETDSWKIRRAATPFGFGLDLHGLSAKQMAIAAALGLSNS